VVPAIGAIIIHILFKRKSRGYIALTNRTDLTSNKGEKKKRSDVVFPDVGDMSPSGRREQSNVCGAQQIFVQQIAKIGGRWLCW